MSTSFGRKINCPKFLPPAPHLKRLKYATACRHTRTFSYKSQWLHKLRNLWAYIFDRGWLSFVKTRGQTITRVGKVYVHVSRVKATPPLYLMLIQLNTSWKCKKVWIQKNEKWTKYLHDKLLNFQVILSNHNVSNTSTGKK